MKQWGLESQRTPLVTSQDTSVPCSCCVCLIVGNLNADETVQGYEVYSSTIADVLSEPSLHTPITVGLFARWGSGKSFLIGRLRSTLPS